MSGSDDSAAMERDPARPFALRLDPPPAGPVDAPGDECSAIALLEGPWLQAFGVELRFPLRSKSNLRRHRRGERRVWAENAEFEARLARCVAERLPAGWDLGDRDAPLRTRPQIVAHVAAVTLIDAPNIDKSALDALQGVAFHNDASVRASSQQTVRRRDAQSAWVGLARLAPTASASDVAAAQVALLHAWTTLGAPPLTVAGQSD